MQVSVETTTGLERKMTVALPGEEIEKEFNERLRNIAKTARLPGFRPGKIPLNVVKKRYGADLWKEITGRAVTTSWYQAVGQEKLRVVGTPKIEMGETGVGKGLEFSAVFEVFPEVELPDVSGISAVHLVGEVSDSDVDEMIEILRKQRRNWEPVEREAADGDRVNIDYAGSKDGVEFDGGSATSQDLQIGAGRMIPGFEEGLIGKKAGDKFTLPLTFPENYHAELAGAAVEFAITVNSVSAESLPAIDEEFFRQLGVEEGGLEAFREEVRKNMQREMKATSRKKLKNSLQKSLMAAAETDLPATMVNQEIQRLRQYYSQMASQSAGGGGGMDFSQYPDEAFMDAAKQSTKQRLILAKFLEIEDIRLDPAKVREAVEELAETYESPETVVAWYYEDNERLADVENQVLEEQVFDRIMELAQVTEKSVSYSEVMQQEAPDEGQDESANSGSAASPEGESAAEAQSGSETGAETGEETGAETGEESGPEAGEARQEADR